MSTSALIDVINLIYDCGLEQKDWNTVLKKICLLVNAKNAGLFAIDLKSGSSRLLGQYRYPLEHFPCNEHYADILPSDLSHAHTVNVYSNANYCVKLNIHKNMNQTKLNHTELSLLQGLYPHFNRAINFSDHSDTLSKNEVILNRALSKLSLGVMALDKQLKVHFKNHMARTLLKDRSDIHIKSGHLLIDNNLEQNNIKQAIEKALRTPSLSSSLLFGRSNPEGMLTITVADNTNKDSDLYTYWINNNTKANNIVILYFSSPDQQVGISLATLQDIYHLTPSEAQLALSVANGLTLQAFSDSKKISIQTARTQLKAIFNKVHVKSQVELVRKLLNGSVNIVL